MEIIGCLILTFSLWFAQKVEPQKAETKKKPDIIVEIILKDAS